MIYMETERLILRDYREDDFNEYYRLKTDSEIINMCKGLSCSIHC